MKFSAECTDAGGTKDGTCADGFGVCCISKYGTASNIKRPTIINFMLV